MRALLDTNIIIYREASKAFRQDIGTLFYWLDRLRFEKCVHPLSMVEIRSHKDLNVVNTMEVKVKNYVELKTQAPESPEILGIRSKYDRNQNDSIDTSLLKEVFAERVDLLITEDRKLHEKARILNIPDRVLTVDAFLERAIAEIPELADYRVLSAKKEYFGNVDVNDAFFDSFKADYPEFLRWFNSKSDEIAYVCRSKSNEILAFLYVKFEGEAEPYDDIEPRFAKKRRLKIGTFKVASNGYKLGERFLKIVFDNALLFRTDEVYVTIFNRGLEQERLINLLMDWGFVLHGVKHTGSDDELVYVRDFTPKADRKNPCLTYPYISRHSRKFIVPIRPEYHTELFPDSILRTESPVDFVENRPNRNAISKVYISRSIERNLVSGDIVVFYRTKGNSPAHYTAVTSTVGVIQNVFTNIGTVADFIRLVGRRSVFSDEQLVEQWDQNPHNRPFIANFLYVHTFPKRLNLSNLKMLGIIADAPRGFTRLSDEAFKKLVEESRAEQRLIVD